VERAVIRWHREGGEPESCHEEPAALVEHGYSITWSARSNIFRPSAFAVLRLITNSNFVGCSTGRLAGLAPFEVL
jgi:hypothetical protein